MDGKILFIKLQRKIESQKSERSRYTTAMYTQKQPLLRPVGTRLLQLNANFNSER